VSSVARVLTVTEMQAHDLRRRRVAVGLLVALPLAFYFSLLTDPEDPFVFVAGGIGMAWSVAGAALFSMLAARHIDPRLVLSGYRPHELLLGRLLLLEGFALLLLVGFSALIEILSPAKEPAALVVGLALAALIGVAVGLAAAAVVPRELEGTLAIVGVVGVNMSVPPDVALAPALPFYGAADFLHRAAGASDAGARALAHALGYTAALLAVAIVFWARRVRVRRGEPL
jgi:hypothetical protein